MRIKGRVPRAVCLWILTFIVRAVCFPFRLLFIAVSFLIDAIGERAEVEKEDVEEGTGRKLGRLGALVCEGEDDGRNISVNVGSGFSKSDRSTFWTSRSDVMGQIVEVRADAVTQNQDGTYSLRFPRFLRFRGFEVGEKL